MAGGVLVTAMPETFPPEGMTEDGKLAAPWPCPDCGGPLVWAAIWSHPNGIAGVVCEKEQKAFHVGEGD